MSDLDALRGSFRDCFDVLELVCVEIETSRAENVRLRTLLAEAADIFEEWMKSSDGQRVQPWPQTQAWLASTRTEESGERHSR